jgi:hypothetical protein
MMLGRAMSRCVLVAGLGWASPSLAGTPARPVFEVELPRQVPAAKLVQQVGLTEIAVDYDRPAVKGRKIWGDVVPYDRPWTIGGKPGAKITFSKDVTIGDKTIPAGTYWLLATPAKGSWTIMINKSPDTIASASDYKPELDVARAKVAVKPVPSRERLTLLFTELSDDRASLDIEWAGVRVSLPIQVNTTRHIEAEISSLDEGWRAYANAARYMLETKKDYDAGLKYIDMSLALQPSDRADWYCLWVKGALLAAKGQYGQARDLGQKAYDLAKASGKPFLLEADLSRAIAAWQKKAGPFEKEGKAPAIATKGDPGDKGESKAGAPATSPPPIERPSEAVKSSGSADTKPSEPAASAPDEHEPTPPDSAKKAASGDTPALRRARLRHR